MKEVDMDKALLRLENLWRDAEHRIMADVVRRIEKNGKITSTADYQINRFAEMGKSTEEVEKIIKESLNATYPEMFEIYDNVTEQEYVRNKDIYEQINGHALSDEENKWKIQISEAMKEQTKQTLENLSQSHGFSVMMGEKRVYMPFATYYQNYVDSAIMDILTGGFDYNTVIRRTVTQMVNSGLRTVEYYDTGHSNRVDVAVRRAIMTGTNQITQQISRRNAAQLGTDYYEVSWHNGARPSHVIWQGRVYKEEELESICGLGDVTGLCGANCRHSYYPFVPGISKRTYSDEWLKEQNEKEAQTKDWQGKKLNAYEQTQQQRKMETAMRAQREKVKLLQEAKAGKEEITIARAKYQAQLNEYKQFSKKMGLPEQRERIYYDMRGRIAPSVVNRKKVSYNNKNSTVKVTDDWKSQNHVSIPKNYNKYAVVETKEGKGDKVQINRTFYDKDGQMYKQIHSGGHRNLKQHPYGNKGEHAHDYEWKEGNIVNRTTRELEAWERKENDDIL